MNIARLLLGICVLTLISMNFAQADIPLPPSPPPQQVAGKTLVNQATFKIERGDQQQSVLYIPAKLGRQLGAGNAPNAGSEPSFGAGPGKRGQIPTVVAGIAFSLALISAGILLLKRRRFSIATTSIIAGAVLIGLSAQVIANRAPPEDPRELAPPPLNSDKIDIVISETHQQVTLVLGKDAKIGKSSKPRR